jgi:integrase
MGTIIQMGLNASVSGNTNNNTNNIDTTALARSLQARLQNCLKPVTKETELVQSVEEHDSEPIKDVNDIIRISDYFISNGQYRNNMLWIVGINFGLRASDLLRLKIYDLIDENFCFRDSLAILEKKTANTRKVRKNRHVTINKAVMDAVLLYLEHTPCSLDDYLFRSESNRGYNVNRPMTVKSVERILKDAKQALGLPQRIATHTMRKTFGYHQMVMGGNDQRRLLLLQKMFGHSSAMQTLSYIGITQEEINEAYLNLNLGVRECYQGFSQVVETA